MNDILSIMSRFKAEHVFPENHVVFNFMFFSTHLHKQNLSIMSRFKAEHVFPENHVVFNFMFFSTHLHKQNLNKI